jgi:hypothetical protein
MQTRIQVAVVGQAWRILQLSVLYLAQTPDMLLRALYYPDHLLARCKRVANVALESRHILFKLN